MTHPKNPIYCPECEGLCVDGQTQCATCGHALAAPPEPVRPEPPPVTPTSTLTPEERARAIDVQRRWNAWDAKRRRHARVKSEIQWTKDSGYCLRVLAVIVALLGAFAGVQQEDLTIAVIAMVGMVVGIAFGQLLIAVGWAWEAFESEYRERHPLEEEPDKPKISLLSDPWAWLDTKIVK